MNDTITIMRYEFTRGETLYSLLVLLVIALIILAFAFTEYFYGHRNNLVYKKKQEWGDKAYGLMHHLWERYVIEEENQQDILDEYNHWYKISTSIYNNVPSYKRMVYSFKPIKDEYWLNEEQRSLIKKYEEIKGINDNN